MRAILATLLVGTAGCSADSVEPACEWAPEGVVEAGGFSVPVVPAGGSAAVPPGRFQDAVGNSLPDSVYYRRERGTDSFCAVTDTSGVLTVVIDRFVNDVQLLHLDVAMTDTHVLILRPTPDGLHGAAVSAARYYTDSGDSLAVRSTLDPGAFARAFPTWASENHSFQRVRPDTLWLTAPFLDEREPTWTRFDPSSVPNPSAYAGLPNSPLQADKGR